MKTPQEECDELIMALLPFAKEMLLARRGFLPFGGALSLSGRVVAVGGGTGEESAKAIDVIAALEVELRQGAASGKYKAAAVFSDRRVVAPDTGAKQDAISIRVEHREGIAVGLVVPYSIDGSGGVALAAPRMAPLDRRIFIM
jgi:hypothetical protein